MSLRHINDVYGRYWSQQKKKHPRDRNKQNLNRYSSNTDKIKK